MERISFEKILNEILYCIYCKKNFLGKDIMWTESERVISEKEWHTVYSVGCPDCWAQGPFEKTREKAFEKYISDTGI